MISFVPFTTEEGTLKMSCFPKQLLTRDLRSRILFPIPLPEPISPFFVLRFAYHSEMTQCHVWIYWYYNKYHDETYNISPSITSNNNSPSTPASVEEGLSEDTWAEVHAVWVSYTVYRWAEWIRHGTLSILDAIWGELLPQLVPCTNKGSTVYIEICEEVSGDIRILCINNTCTWDGHWL